MPSNWKAYAGLTLVNADTEYSQALSSDVKFIAIKSRSAMSDLKISFVSGESGTNFTTIFGGAEWRNPEKLQTPNSETIYVQSSQAGTVVEIEEWR